MSSTIVVVLLVIALWGLISATGEGALGLHHMDAYGPLSAYNDEGDGITTTGKIAGGVTGVFAAVLLFMAASSYIKNKNKPPEPVPTSTPVASPTAAPTKEPEPVKTPEPVKQTPKPVATPTTKVTPAATSTPKPDTPEDIAFERQKIKVGDVVLSRDYKGAMKLIDELEEKAPNDPEVLFYRFLALQGLDQDDEAKEYAERILKDFPRSKYRKRLNKFLASLELRKKRKKLGGHFSANYGIEKGSTLELSANGLLAEAGDAKIDELIASQVGLELITPEPEVKPLTLSAADTVTPIKSIHFYLRVASGEVAWERSRETRGSAELDLVYVQVTSGKKKGKKGWLLNNLKGASTAEGSVAGMARNILGLGIIR
jgi:hypothetical protein